MAVVGIHGVRGHRLPDTATHGQPFGLIKVITRAMAAWRISIPHMGVRGSYTLRLCSIMSKCRQVIEMTVLFSRGMLAYGVVHAAHALIINHR